MKQKKLILVKLIGIGNNKDDDKNEKDDKDYNNDDEKSKSNYEYEGDDDSEYKNNKGSDNENNKGSDNENENSVYWCFDEASEYKGWVIKLVLTTPVKF